MAVLLTKLITSCNFPQTAPDHTVHCNASECPTLFSVYWQWQVFVDHTYCMALVVSQTMETLSCEDPVTSRLLQLVCSGIIVRRVRTRLPYLSQTHHVLCSGLLCTRGPMILPLLCMLQTSQITLPPYPPLITYGSEKGYTKSRGLTSICS